jgi:hypothetical protein
LSEKEEYGAEFDKESKTETSEPSFVNIEAPDGNSNAAIKF